tara:strand:+ start:54972 stop:55733 length:762 start_codon:yes stop_codon:yes gene_type:complete
MKIGLLCNFYGFPQYTHKALRPWVNIPEVKQVAVSSYKYSDYVKCGWDYDDIETPKQLLEDYRGFVNYICIGSDGDDSFSRNVPLQHLLSHDLDYIWMLDQDEFYTEDQIKNVIEFVSNNQDFATYKINFKNFVFSEKEYIENFIAPRIFSVNYEGKKTLSYFYYENDVAYNINNKIVDYKNLKICEIPKDKCFPDHFSWVGDKEFLKAKVKYQLKRYNGICSYKWDHENDKLIFDDDHYTKFNLEKPEVKKI